MKEGDEAMTHRELIASMPRITGFTPDFRRMKGTWNKLEALGQKAVVDATTIFTGLLNGARDVGVDLTFHRPATLLNIITECYEPDRAGQVRMLLPPLYKGVSYNPAGANWREWLVLLDFFAIMRQFTSHRIQTAVLDASLYWVVNLLGAKGLVLTSPDPLMAATELVMQLRGHVALKSPDQAVYEIALQRNAYMRAVAEQFPAQSAPPVFSVMDVWDDPGFLQFLAVALRNFCRFKSGFWQVIKAVSYQRYMAYSPWVTPLVAAEQSYMAYRNGFQMFLAPVQEAAWNKAVDEMTRLTRTRPYAVLMYDRPKSGELAYSDFPTFNDSMLAAKLARNPVLLPIVAGYVKPFLNPDSVQDLKEAVEHGRENEAANVISEFTTRIHFRANELYQGGFQAMPLDKLGWLMQFPPGTC